MASLNVRIVIPRWRFVVARILMEPVAIAYSVGIITEADVGRASERLARWAVATVKLVED